VKSFYAKCQALTVKEYDDFRVGSTYAALSNYTMEWARLTAKEYDDSRASPEYIDSVQEIKRDSGPYPVPPDDAIVIQYVSEASPVSKGMEKTTESPEEDLVASMDTSKFVSPISPADDTWPTIARESILYWDTIAREADLHLKGENGLLKRDEIVTAHIADSLQQDMLPDAINFADELHIFAVPLPLSNPAISTSLSLVMPSSTKLHADLTFDSDSSSLYEVLGLSSSICEVTRLKKISSSVDEVAPGHEKTSPRANDVARILDGSFNPI
jgi:hypothetical protein